MSEEQNVNEQDRTGGEDQQQHGQDGPPHVLRAGGEDQQAQGGKGQAEEAAKQVVRAGAKATVGSTAWLAQNGRQAPPLQAIDVKALSQSLDSVVQSGVVLTRGGQQAWTQWVNYSGHAIDRNVRAFNELARIRSIGGLIAWQTELMKANIEDWLHSNVQIYQLSAQAAKEATDKIRESGVQAARAAQQRDQA